MCWENGTKQCVNWLVLLLSRWYWTISFKNVLRAYSASSDYKNAEPMESSCLVPKALSFQLCDLVVVERVSCECCPLGRLCTTWHKYPIWPCGPVPELCDAELQHNTACGCVAHLANCEMRLVGWAAQQKKTFDDLSFVSPVLCTGFL